MGKKTAAEILTDAKEQATKILEAAREEGHNILEAAKKEAEEIMVTATEATETADKYLEEAEEIKAAAGKGHRGGRRKATRTPAAQNVSTFVRWKAAQAGRLIHTLEELVNMEPSIIAAWIDRGWVEKITEKKYTATLAAAAEQATGAMTTKE